MKEYKREYPQFSLCGLNCGLCPRYQTEGSSKCPGCGGENFHIQHPTCAVVTCNKKHDNVEFCFQCSSYTCERYGRIGKTDSFITYHNVLSDFEKAKRDGIEQYAAMLNEKIEILEYLINNYNDGRSKNFYCVAVNLMEPDLLRDVMKKIREEIGISDAPAKDKIREIRTLLEARAADAGLELKLRK
jgi:hypothetical protein